MPFDASPYVEVDALRGIDASAAGATFVTATGDICEVSSFGPGIFRIRIGPRTRPDYGLVRARSKPCRSSRRGDTWVFESGEASLAIEPTPLRIRLSLRGAVLTGSTTDQLPQGPGRLPAFGRTRQGSQWLAALAVGATEPVYGLGEKQGPLDKRGQLLQSCHGEAATAGRHPAGEVPFAWSPVSGQGAWGVFVHTPGTVVHGVGHPEWSARSYTVIVEDEALDLFLFAADAPAGVIAQYATLTGSLPALPAWSLGLWLAPADQEPAVTLAARWREQQLPGDVMVLGSDPRAAEGDGGDTSVARRTRMRERAALAADHWRVCLRRPAAIGLREPEFPSLLGEDLPLRGLSGSPEVGWPDFTLPATREWWRRTYADTLGEDTDAVDTRCAAGFPSDAVARNGDRGRRIANVYALLYERCVSGEGPEQPQDDPPPRLVWAHGGWTGAQRLPVRQLRPAQSDWEGLAASIRGGLSWGMSGVPCYGTEIGGAFGPEATPELFVRWLQAAVFGSILRITARGDGELACIGSAIEPAVRKWLLFRYKLLPYLQGACRDASRTGLPVMRAMPLAFPGSMLVRQYETQFMCGDALLVAPIQKPGGEVEIALPPGAWFDLNTRQRLPGQRVVRYRASLDQFPVFGREGHVLPLGVAAEHAGDIDPKRPLAGAWIFGKPTQPLEGFSQLRVHAEAGALRVAATPDLTLERFGDAADLTIAPLA